MKLLDALLSRLPGRLSRWWPSTRGALALKDVLEDGTLLPAKGSPRAVLRLPVVPFDGGATVADLTRLAAAINASAGRATLLAWGKPHTLAGQITIARERADRHTGGRRELAVSQATHLAVMAEGRPPTADRPAIPPVRRHGFYLVIESPSAEDLAQLADNLCALHGAVRCRGLEAAAVEADVWRGVPLPPSFQFWSEQAADKDDVELYLGPGGANVRRFDPLTGAKVEQLFP